MKITPQIIETYLQAEDIEGLLALGAPKNEYADEALSIARALENWKDIHVSEAAQIIAHIWQRSFQLTSDDILKRRQAFQSIAALVLKN